MGAPSTTVLHAADRSAQRCHPGADLCAPATRGLEGALFDTLIVKGSMVGLPISMIDMACLGTIDLM